MLATAHKEKTDDLRTLADQRINLESRKQMCRLFLDSLNSQHTALAEFDEPLWNLLVETVTVHAGRLVFIFKNGMEIEKTI